LAIGHSEKGIKGGGGKDDRNERKRNQSEKKRQRQVAVTGGTKLGKFGKGKGDEKGTQKMGPKRRIYLDLKEDKARDGNGGSKG